MVKTLGWLRIAFLSLFVVLTTASWVYEIYWAAPRKRCVAAGRWWNDQYRECGIPVSVSRFTGRPSPGETPHARRP